MSLYPGIAAVIDIDKLSSFRSEFGPETLHLAKCHLLYSTPSLFSSGYHWTHRIQINFRIREVLKGATSRRCWDIIVCRVISPPCKSPSSPVGREQAAVDDRCQGAEVFIVSPMRVVSDWASRDSAVCLSYPRSSALQLHNLSFKACECQGGLQKSSVQILFFSVCSWIYIYFGRHLIFWALKIKRGLICSSEQAAQTGRQLRHIWADSSI